MFRSLFDFFKTKRYFTPDAELMHRIQLVRSPNTNAFGVDPFGCDPESILLFSPIALWLYRTYFRCKVYGVKHIPQGPMMVISNHAGQLPFDGWMLKMAFLMAPKKPRLLRGMAERLSAELPFISPLFARMGQLVGDPRICSQLLQIGEAVMVFPEGVRGINKLFTQRYQLQSFGNGFVRLAIQHQVPILPVAIIGPEEQAPAIHHIQSLATLMNLPAFPLVLPQLVPIPLPVKYRFHIGKPIWLPTTSANNIQTIRSHTLAVKKTMKTLIERGLRTRKRIFF